MFVRYWYGIYILGIDKQMAIFIIDEHSILGWKLPTREGCNGVHAQDNPQKNVQVEKRVELIIVWSFSIDRVCSLSLNLYLSLYLYLSLPPPRKISRY